MIFVICELNHYPNQDTEEKREEKVEQEHYANELLIKEKVKKLMTYEKKLSIVQEVLQKKEYESQEYKYIEKHVQKMM